MDLQTWVNVAEIVSAVAVAATLIVLVVSVRQNTRAQKALAVDSLAAAIAAINVPAIESATVGAAVASATADWTSATREERIIAHYFLFAWFKLQENAWYQQRSKILDRDQWLGWDRVLRSYYHSKGVREVWWPHRCNSYSRDFQAYLAQTEPADDIGSLQEIFDLAPAAKPVA